METYHRFKRCTVEDLVPGTPLIEWTYYSKPGRVEIRLDNDRRYAIAYKVGAYRVFQCRIVTEEDRTFLAGIVHNNQWAVPLDPVVEKDCIVYHETRERLKREADDKNEFKGDYFDVVEQLHREFAGYKRQEKLSNLGI